MTPTSALSCHLPATAANPVGRDTAGPDSGGRDGAPEPRQRAQAALQASPLGELRELTVLRDGQHLLISGRVHCFYYKQLAQETVRPYCADLRLLNEVSVIS